jgi:hypothetical protein
VVGGSGEFCGEVGAFGGSSEFGAFSMVGGRSVCALGGFRGFSWFGAVCAVGGRSVCTLGGFRGFGAVCALGGFGGSGAVSMVGGFAGLFSAIFDTRRSRVRSVSELAGIACAIAGSELQSVETHFDPKVKIRDPNRRLASCCFNPGAPRTIG